VTKAPITAFISCINQEDDKFLEYMLARAEELDRYCLGDLGWALLSYRKRGSVPIPGLLTSEAAEIFAAITGADPRKSAATDLTSN